MIADLFDILFGCWHKNYSFPITNRRGERPSVSGRKGTYVVCLDCGKEFPYDWQQMKIVSREPAEKVQPIAEPAAERARAA